VQPSECKKTNPLNSLAVPIRGRPFFLPVNEGVLIGSSFRKAV
jgi:hypothetical protein